MKTRWMFLIPLLAILLAACSSEPPTVGTSTAFAAACDKANDGKRIAITGYLNFPDSISGDSVVLRMFQADDFTGAPVGVQADFGIAANQVEKVTDQYVDSDLKIHLANGQISGYGSRVKVSGKVYFPLVGQDFACGLENPLVEAAD
jgi:hypothetical protein